MDFEKISSRQNPHVRRLAELRERAARAESGLFLIEGMRELERAAANGIEFVEFCFCPELIRNPLAEKIFASARERLAPTAIFELSRPAFEKISYRDRPEGVLAVARAREHTLETLPAFGGGDKGGSAPLFLVAESVEKPGNLGALARVADSAGCSALICCGDGGTDVYNPNAIRASQGTLFSVPIAVAPAHAVRDRLFARGVTIFATAPAAEKIYWECDFRVPAAVLMGTEATGLSEFWLSEKTADARVVPVAIPQLGAADSLNVSAAASICLFEALRQRKTAN